MYLSELDIGKMLTNSIIMLFAFLMPLAILAGRFAIKRQRQSYLVDLVGTLQVAVGPDVELIPTVEYALQKYDLVKASSRQPLLAEFAYFSSTAFLFALISWAGFAFALLFSNSTQSGDDGIWWGKVLFLLSGFTAEPTETYAKFSAGVIVLTFLGSYTWSINYLIGRIANFDLSPVSFLRVTAKIILACAVALAIRHISTADGGSGGVIGVAPEAAILVVALLTGMFPDVGLNYLTDRAPALQVKRLDKETAATLRQMPVELIDGINSQVSFRLAEREIYDIQNLAAENPILLSVETPYAPLEILDWIAQAQLILEVGPAAFRLLRTIGIRTVFALEEARTNPDVARLVLGIIHADAAIRPSSIEAVLDPIRANVHVERLWQVHRILRAAYQLHADRNSHPPVLELRPDDTSGLINTGEQMN